ncbi:hypothetical protein BVRB_019280, partial [Beta vulgaris subsp. vulgaris]
TRNIKSVSPFVNSTFGHASRDYEYEEQMDNNYGFRL